MESDLYRVLEAVNDGAGHSGYVAELTGLSIAEASAHLSVLLKRGFIRRTGEIFVTGGRGRRSVGYEIVDEYRLEPSTEG